MFFVQIYAQHDENIHKHVLYVGNANIYEHRKLNLKVLRRCGFIHSCHMVSKIGTSGILKYLDGKFLKGQFSHKTEATKNQ